MCLRIHRYKIDFDLKNNEEYQACDVFQGPPIINSQQNQRPCKLNSLFLLLSHFFCELLSVFPDKIIISR